MSNSFIDELSPSTHVQDDNSSDVLNKHDDNQLKYQTIIHNKHAEFEENVSMLIMELLKWRYLRERRSNAVKRIITKHRRKIPEMLEMFPQLEMHLFDSIWYETAWKTGVMLIEHVTGFRKFFPEKPIWSIGELVDNKFFPE